MAKLILKQQEPPKGSWLHHHGSQVAYAGFIALLLLISLGILFAFRPSPVALQSQPLPSISSATNPKVKAQYLSDWEKLLLPGYESPGSTREKNRLQEFLAAGH